MANDCLLTKLKSVIQNDSLEKLGVFTLTIPSDASERMFTVSANKPTKITFTGGTISGNNYYNIKSLNTLEPISITPNSAESDIVVTFPKYDWLNYFKANESDPYDAKNIVDDLNFIEYNPNITYLTTTFRRDANTNLFKNLSNLTTVKLRGNLFGDFSNFNNNITDIFISSPTFTVTTEELFSRTNLREVYVYAGSFTGEISTLADKQVENGRTSGTFELIGTRLTYKGTVITVGARKTIKFGSSMQNPTAEETAQGWQVVNS